MANYVIYQGKNVSWQLFTEKTVGFCTDTDARSITQVLNLVRDVFLDIFGHENLSKHPILSVFSSSEGPSTFRRHNLIFLSSTGRYYLQHIYQFSHELCHFMVPDNVCSAYRWFEETLCEAMSWYVLQRIYDMGAANPFPWLSSLFLEDTDYISRCKAKRIPLRAPVSVFLSEQLDYLRQQCYDRPVNCAIAYELYPLFEEYPQLWKIVLHLHLLNDGMDLPHAIHMLLTAADVVHVGGSQLQALLCERFPVPS